MSGLLCRECKTKMKLIQKIGFDAFTFSILNEIEEQYCPNEKCKMVGIVVVFGVRIREDKK